MYNMLFSMTFFINEEKKGPGGNKKNGSKARRKFSGPVESASINHTKLLSIFIGESDIIHLSENREMLMKNG